MKACPHCGRQPALVLDEGRQAFCGNEACDVLTWNAALTPEELSAVEPTVVDLGHI